MGVRAPRPEELPLLSAIGEAAGRRFAEVGLPDVADDPPFEVEELEAWRAAERAWVATDAEDRPVGFAVVDLVDGCAHLEEVSVEPDHAGEGHGAALLAAVEAWARSEGLAAVTLTTFADVPFNRPWYERRGYRVLAEEEWTPGLVARRAEEAEAGLDPGRRVVMRKDG